MANMIEHEIFPRGEKNTAFAQYFIGQSYLNMLTTQGVGIGNVTFEPGCRNNWHIHHAKEGGGQILLVTGGRGWYQEWGQPARELHAGDVVVIPAGVKHWHGAARVRAPGRGGPRRGHPQRVVRAGGRRAVRQAGLI